MTQLLNDLRSYFEHITNRTPAEQVLLDRLNGGYFPIYCLHRQDLEEEGFDIRAVSDNAMINLANALGEDYRQQLLTVSLEIIAEGNDIPRFPCCPNCERNYVVFDTSDNTYNCKECGQQWGDSYVLVEEPEETDQLSDDLRYPCANAQNSNARYISEYDYIRIFGKKPEPDSYFEPVRWPESQKYMPDDDEDGEPAGDSVNPRNELINDELGLEDFGENAYWVPKCNLK